MNNDSPRAPDHPFSHLLKNHGGVKFVCERTQNGEVIVYEFGVPEKLFPYFENSVFQEVIHNLIQVTFNEKAANPDTLYIVEIINVKDPLIKIDLCPFRPELNPQPNNTFH